MDDVPLIKAAGFKPRFQGDKEDPKRMAYHEAGHAVLGLILGRELNYVSLEEGDQGANFEELEDSSPGVSELRIKTALAGPIAEHHWFGSSWGCLGDIRRIQDELEEHPLDGLNTIKALADSVWEAFGSQWDSVARVAEELHKKRRLEVKDVQRLVAGEAPADPRQEGDDNGG